MRIRLPTHERAGGRSQSGGSHNLDVDRLATLARVGPAASEHLPVALAVGRRPWQPSHWFEQSALISSMTFKMTCWAWRLRSFSSQGFLQGSASRLRLGATAAARLPVLAADSWSQRPRQSSWVAAGRASGWVWPVRPVAPAWARARQLEDPAQFYIAQDIVDIIVGINRRFQLILT